MTVFDFLAHSALPRPDVSLDDARRVAAERYGVQGEITELGSNQDRNFLLDDGTRRLLLKFSNAVFGDDELRAQNLAADAVAGAGMRAPRCVSSVDGADIVTVGSLKVRLLTFVEGEQLTEAGFDPAALGSLSARVALALRCVDHAGTRQRTQWNLQSAGDVVDRLIDQIPDAARRDRVRSVSQTALGILSPVRDTLRTQVIHGDLTDDNAVASPGGAVDGVIDFGDVAESWTVAELAVTCIATLHHNPRQPLAVLDTLAAFHELLPLTDDELDALWPLVQLRAAVLVVSGEHQVALEPDNLYADQNR
ncbi:MAG: hypothetical protein JWP32_870, partial [Schumannella sp.]|nr:hypothetical protein [Schumannella sp.]